ncbi:hypothetical protein GWI33_012480 [Rhynchophorus ferrugineus]|uniref:Uncharacterized protein n=1 Tax=Rhynchophorus ferrugineus TaxID=354439 RepID=A0A834I5F3_RHYFE|nr:hypothetical protein GWI33_012480 [Rhynchophorus ferrugineus]
MTSVIGQRSSCTAFQAQSKKNRPNRNTAIKSDLTLVINRKFPIAVTVCQHPNCFRWRRHRGTARLYKYHQELLDAETRRRTLTHRQNKVKQNSTTFGRIARYIRMVSKGRLADEASGRCGERDLALTTPSPLYFASLLRLGSKIR